MTQSLGSCQDVHTLYIVDSAILRIAVSINYSLWPEPGHRWAAVSTTTLTHLRQSSEKLTVQVPVGMHACCMHVTGSLYVCYVMS